MHRYHAVFVLSLALAAACSDPAGPALIPGVPISMKFCDSPPAWFAYQNEGGGWTQATPYGSTLTFDATPKVTVAYAYVYSNPTRAEVTVLHMTAEQLDRVDCGSSPIGKTANGLVRGLTGSQSSFISLGPTGLGYATEDYPSYTIFGIPVGALDLIASRQDYSPSASLPDRLIFRRAQSFPNGATIPELDFDGQEAFSPVASTVTLTGASNADVGYASNVFRSASGSFLLLYDGPIVGGSVTIQDVPSSRLAATDIHEFEASASNFSAHTDRAILHVYHEAGNKTLALGPELSAPTWSTIATAPYVRPRARINSQSEYDALAVVDYYQQLGQGSRQFSVVATREHFGGTPATWELSVPDLSRVPGFQSAWGLQTGAYEWKVTAMDIRLDLGSDEMPAVGETFRYASLGSPSNIQLARASVARNPIRLRDRLRSTLR